MKKAIQRFLLLSAVFAVAACSEYPVYYVNPAPPPLQPYMEPAPAVTVSKKVVKRRYVRRHRRVRCRCAATP